MSAGADTREESQELRAPGDTNPTELLLESGAVLRLSEADAAAFCSGLKSEVSRLKVPPTVEEVLRACQQRMPDAACGKCLGIR